MSKGQTNTHGLEEAILAYVSASQVSKTEIRKHIKTSYNDSWSKKDVKRSLKQLVTQKKLHKTPESKKYFIPSKNNLSESSSSDGETSNSEKDSGEQSFVPIAQLMRKQQCDDEKTMTSASINRFGSEKIKSKQRDLDEEIRRLEAELAVDSESDDESSEGTSYEVENRKVSFGKTSTRIFTKDEDENTPNLPPDIDSSGVICLSQVANERIEPLPAAAMPKIARNNTGFDSEKRSKKRKREREEHTINEGLKHAVEDLLNNYKTRSEVEQTPWYCRVCQHQAEGEADFIAHRQSELHKAALKEHQKKTYCRMCRKQMTSVIQFQEHLSSRPHRDMLARKRNQQQGRGRDDRRTLPGRGWSRDGKQVGRGNRANKRQWC